MTIENNSIMDETSLSSDSFDSSSSSSSSIQPTITKTKSNKRKTMLSINGYNFQFKNFNKNKTKKFWRCASRSCGMLLHTNLEDEFLCYSGNKKDHTHLPNPAEAEIRNLRETMKQRAESDLEPLQAIAEQEMRKALLTGEALALLPGASVVGKTSS